MKKSLFAFFVSLSLALAGVSSLSKAGSLPVKAESEEAPRFENEVEADRNELAFTLTGSSLTPCSQSFTLSMQSVKIEAYNNSTRYNNVFVRIDDANYTDFQTAKKNAEDAQDAAEKENKEYVPAVYNATVFNVSNSKASATTIVLPNFIDYGTLFRLQVSSIEANVCYDYDSKSLSYANIKEIIIPEGYQKISTDAFLGAKEAGVAIKAASSGPGENWEEGWTDADVEYGVALTSSQQRALEVRTTGITTFGEGKSFFVGYFNPESPETNKPLTMEYRLLDSNDNPVGQTQYYELPKASTTLDYDAVGTIAGKAKDDRSVDVEIPEGTHIDESSIIFHNIFRLVKNGSGSGVIIEPDSEPLKATPVRSYSRVMNFGDFLEVSSGKASYFAGYSRFSLKANLKTEIFESINPNVYNQNKASIDNGTLRVRISLSSLGSAKYRVVYEGENGETIVSTILVRTPIGTINLSNGEEIGFLIKDSDVGEGFSFSKVRSLRLCGFYLQVDLYNGNKNSIVNNSKKSVRFGSIDILPQGGLSELKVIDLAAYFAISYSCYVGLFALLAVGYFFYCKKKYRNDEFRRVNPKKYWLKSLRNLFGYGLIFSSILFIVARWGLLSSTVVVFNILDVWVIVFTIAGAIFLGLAIKEFVVSIKQTMERKKKEKLHLDADVAEDGTK